MNGYKYWDAHGVWLPLMQTVPTLLYSDPGEGKTSLCQSLADQMRTEAGPAELIVIVASHLDPTEINGVMIADREAGAMRRLLSEFAYRAKIAHSEGRYVILLLDEFMRAPSTQRAACLRILSEYQIGDYQLDRDMTMIVLTGNPEGSGVSSGFDPADANRCSHIDYLNPPENVIEGFVNGWNIPLPVLPQDWKDEMALKKYLVAAFLQSKPELTRNKPKDLKLAKGPWPSPRSWELTARYLAGMDSLEPDPEVDAEGHDGWAASRMRGICSIIGEGAGMEFNTFIKNLDLPTMDEVRESVQSGKLTFEMPKRGDRTMVVCGMIRNAATEHKVDGKADPKLWGKAFDLLADAFEFGNGDIVMKVALDLYDSKHPKAKVSPKSAKTFQELLELHRNC